VEDMYHPGRRGLQFEEDVELNCGCDRIKSKKCISISLTVCSGIPLKHIIQRRSRPGKSAMPEIRVSMKVASYWLYPCGCPELLEYSFSLTPMHTIASGVYFEIRL
jgi:hypothetical protein